MENFILATQTGGILGPFAWILGKILEVIYNGFAFLGIYNIGFCIIIFTLVVRMLMLPMQIKQQKFTKLNAVMTPEIQGIQKKYKNRKDQQAQLAQQEEIKAVYDKYGTSPTGSCLQLIIQMPILFALYRVIMNVPAYVQPVKDLYLKVLYGLDVSQMKQFFGIDKIAKELSTEKLNGCIDAMSGYSRGSGSVSLTKGTSLQTILDVSDKGVADKIDNINNFFGLNLSMSPSAMFNAGLISIIVALIIPILSGLFQFLSVQISQKLNGAAMNAQDNPMAGSMKIMNFMMPLMSVYMCWILSAGLGLYWMAGSLIMMLQQIFINLYMKKIDVNDIIEANKEKAAAKAEKRKEKEGIYRERVLEASKTSTRNISGNSNMSANEREEKIRKAKEAAAKNNNSMASKVNMVNEYNKRNEK
ncbi:YidC/Oxa1 family membrane protein insertase [uncultured Eubacterium sp.]|uniref:YidC/Oxa1 family membrane protein insertase n=1 Tax=uncultured Eubacterium sp. TaxID=165185 RepID=UPI0026727D84|nr:YidC/Oxa1 family membrane protein insertase [uncultured Eubacterium sp.]